jgi:hypothetical protein
MGNAEQYIMQCAIPDSVHQPERQDIKMFHPLQVEKLGIDGFQDLI